MNRTVFALCVSALIGLFFLPKAQADGRRLMITIQGGSVEIPGRVLAPGEYEFQYLVDSNGPAVVKVSSYDHRQNYGWFFVDPAERARATDNAEVYLDEPAANSPERIREWFFPGEKEGHEFVYRTRTRHHRLASLRATRQPMVSATASEVKAQR